MSARKSNTGNIWDPLLTRNKITLPSCSLFKSDRNCWTRMLGTTRGCVKFTYVSQPWLLREWLIFSFSFSIILLVQHQMIVSISWTKGWRPDILSDSWGKGRSRTSILSISLNMMGLLLCFWDRILATSCLPNSLQRQLFQRVLPKNFPFPGWFPFENFRELPVSEYLCEAQQWLPTAFKLLKWRLQKCVVTAH